MVKFLGGTWNLVLASSLETVASICLYAFVGKLYSAYYRNMV